jgi:hypothetical protein
MAGVGGDMSLLFTLAFLVGFAENSYGSVKSRMRGRRQRFGGREADKLRKV